MNDGANGGFIVFSLLAFRLQPMKIKEGQDFSLSGDEYKPSVCRSSLRLMELEPQEYLLL